MKLGWSHTSLADLEHVIAFVAEDNPAAAAHLADAIRDAVDSLVRFPAMGRPGRVPDTRELVVAGTPYIIPYRAAGGTIMILSVLHAARRGP